MCRAFQRRPSILLPQRIHLSLILALSFRWRPVGVEDGIEFQWLEQETVTNSSGTRHTVDKLQPYTVYTFAVTAINTVGRSTASKQSYPAVTLMESKYGKKEGHVAIPLCGYRQLRMDPSFLPYSDPPLSPLGPRWPLLSRRGRAARRKLQYYMAELILLHSPSSCLLGPSEHNEKNLPSEILLVLSPPLLPSFL